MFFGFLDAYLCMFLSRLSHVSQFASRLPRVHSWSRLVQRWLADVSDLVDLPLFDGIGSTRLGIVFFSPASSHFPLGVVFLQDFLDTSNGKAGYCQCSCASWSAVSLLRPSWT